MSTVDESEPLAQLRRGAVDEAATWVLRTYGAEVMAWLLAFERDVEEARDVYAIVSAAIWRSMPSFRGDCSLRTYAYAVARRQLARSQRTRARRPLQVPLSREVESIAAQLRTSTAEYLRTGPRERLTELRDSLDEEDRVLLTLRLNRQLSWREIARVLATDDAPEDAALERHAAALRKRFERLKEKFREELRKPDR
jgi:RNA polymerase sigma-70 factor (ECF subfamily)